MFYNYNLHNVDTKLYIFANPFFSLIFYYPGMNLALTEGPGTQQK